MSDLPTSRSMVDRMRPGDLDITMSQLGLTPFHPSMPVGKRRRFLWRALTKHLAVRRARKPGHLVIDKAPSACPTAIPAKALAARIVYAAAISGIAFDDLCNVVLAHYLGLGELVDPKQTTMNLLTRINVLYGWGFRQYVDGTVEVYC